MGKKVIITEKQFGKIFDIMLPITYDNPLTYLMCDNGVIKEGLIKTYPFDVMKRYICQYFNIKDYYFHEYESNGVRCAAIDIDKDPSYVKMFDKAMNLCGYFKSQSMELDTKIRVHYEPKFEEKEKYEGEFLYHLTHYMNIPKIKRIGLVPSNKNKRFNYDDRIYLFSSDVPKDLLIEFSEKLYQAHEKELDDRMFCILKIKKDGSFNLFKDPNIEYGYWTRDNIPPSLIMNDIEKFEI